MENSTQRVQVMRLEDLMGDRFGRYSKYIIQDRALPDARDGLKPVQRRILSVSYTHLLQLHVIQTMKQLMLLLRRFLIS